MKTLFKNGTVVNVFTGELLKENVLTDNDLIIGVGDYADTDADITVDINGKYICPGFIDGHIHIESTMLTPYEFSKVSVPHGTTTVITDPHEIANVCGTAGIEFMLKASENLPLNVYIMLPSCVPSTEFDESGAILHAKDLEPFYSNNRVLGLAEVMNYPGVIKRDPDVMEKIQSALDKKLTVNGHAPLLSGKELDLYIGAGIRDDHECSSVNEAIERIRKGQHVMIRQGTAARNLEALLPLFDEPWAHQCLLVTDDKHPADLINHGHIDDIIRSAAKAGKSAVTGIRMATLWAAEYFGLKNLGAIAPGYTADLLILNDLDTVLVEEVYHNGVQVAKDGKALDFDAPTIDNTLKSVVYDSFNMPKPTKDSFIIDAHGKRKCRTIRLIKGELLTDEFITDIDFDTANGIDISRDILKIAVAERHNNTGHIGLGYIVGTGLKSGAIASSVSHDSHNLILIGANEDDMAFAAEHIRSINGGCAVVKDGKVIAEMPLPIGGLMSDVAADIIAKQNEELRKSVHTLGVPDDIELFMTTAFVSLPVIPHIKMTTKGLVDVDRQKLLPLFYE